MPEKNFEGGKLPSAEPLTKTPGVASNPETHQQSAQFAELKARTTIEQRRQKANELRQQGKTLKEIVESTDNNYTDLEALYKLKVGCDLNADPYESTDHPIPITKKCTIVIPAYNSGRPLESTLRAIQASSFNAKYPQHLEIIVVDDGSPNVNIAESVKTLHLEDLNIKVFRESNGRENKARYAGVTQATGDIVILTTQDVVLSPTMIEETMKRHEVLDDIVGMGFRDNIDPNDRRILTAEQIAQGTLGELGYDFNGDSRIARDGMRDCNWLKDAGQNKPLPIDADQDDWYGWTLQSATWGIYVSAPRTALLATRASHDVRYTGFGGDDEHMVADLIADGHYVIPITSGLAHHLKHDSRYDADQSAINRAVWEEYLGKVPVRQDPAHPYLTDATLLYEQNNQRTEPTEPRGMPGNNIYDRAVVQLKMGLYEKAIASFEEAYETHNSDPWFLHDMGVALMRSGVKDNTLKAIQLLEQANSQLENSFMRSSLAQAYGRAGQYDTCIARYQEALRLNSDNPEAKLIEPDVGSSVDAHVDKLTNIGTKLLFRNKPREALRYLEIAIALRLPKSDVQQQLRDLALSKIS
jgi:glycosyltransferase involved in cell wall biosynthesis